MGTVIEPTDETHEATKHFPKKKPPGAMAESLMLHRNGTKIAEITPGTIITAARADLSAKEYNTRLRAERKEFKAEGFDPNELGFTKKYSFLPKHVRKAKTELDLIKLAIAKNTDATSSQNINVRRICDSIASLHIAAGQLS